MFEQEEKNANCNCKSASQIGAGGSRCVSVTYLVVKGSTLTRTADQRKPPTPPAMTSQISQMYTPPPLPPTLPPYPSYTQSASHLAPGRLINTQKCPQIPTISNWGIRYTSLTRKPSLYLSICQNVILRCVSDSISSSSSTVSANLASADWLTITMDSIKQKMTKLANETADAEAEICSNI